MTILFAVLVLALLVLGLRKRKKETKQWVKEERYEESGDWLDKRAGERGAYGSLDDEMEANRQYVAMQSKVSELCLSVQGVLFEQSTDFQALSDSEIKQHQVFCKSEFLALFNHFQQYIAGKSPSMAPSTPYESALSPVLKKLILDFAFERFPKLLDLEIENIQKMDRQVEQLVSKLLGEVAKLKQKK